jgi:hypothetical protein
MKKMLKIVCIGAAMAVLAIGVSANGAGSLLSRYEFEGSWNNSGTSTWAVTPYGGAALGVAGVDPGANRSYKGSGLLNDANIQSSTSWLQVGYDTTLDAVNGGISTQMTIASWVKYTSTSTSLQRIMGRGYSWYMDANTDGGAHQQYAQLIVRDSAFPTVVIGLQGDTSIGDGLWHHVAGTWDTATGAMNLYVDGLLDATKNTGVATSIQQDSRYAIGARASAATTGTSIYRGRVDDVRVYNVAMSQDQIQTEVMPEPTTIALLSLGSTLIFRRRRT